MAKVKVTGVILLRHVLPVLIAIAMLLVGGGGGVVGEDASVNKNNLPVSNVVSTSVVVEEPEFTEIIENITVPAGRNIKLACSVKNLGSYKVAWMHFEQSAILTVHNHVITRNPRISVTHDKYDKHRTWFLHINDVKEEDKGRYMCQINTVTAKTQFGYLHVVVPPNIDDSLSSSDIIVREGANITLKCKATGSPAPTVKWKRDDNSKIAINKSLIVTEWDGETLEVSRISRLDMGSYLCIASNGVPPSVSKRIKVSVDFPPMMMIPHQLVGVTPRTNVTLECLTEAHPTSLNYWTKEDGHMIHDSRKFRSESIVGHPTYKTTMRLTIASVEEEDENSYKCVAKNPRGESEGTIRLYLSPPLVAASSSTVIPSTSSATNVLQPDSNNGDWDNEIYVRFNKSLFKQTNDDKFGGGRNGKKLDKFEHQNSIGGHHSKGFSKYPLGNFDAESGADGSVVVCGLFVGSRNIAATLLLWAVIISVKDSLFYRWMWW